MAKITKAGEVASVVYKNDTITVTFLSKKVIVDEQVNSLAVANAAVAYLGSVKEATDYAPKETILSIKGKEFKADEFTTSKAVELAELLLGGVTPEEFIKGEKVVDSIKFSAKIVVDGIEFELSNETVEFKTDFVKP